MTGNVSELRLAADSLGIRFFDRITSGLFDATLVSSLPVDWARRHCALPVRIPDGAALLVVPDASAIPLVQQASLATGEELAPALASRETILKAIDEAWYAGRSTGEPSTAKTAPDADSANRPLKKNTPDTSGADLLLARDEPVERFWADTLLEAVRKGASDVHADPLPDGSTSIRFRLSGSLYEQPPPPQGLAKQIVSRIKVLAKMDIAEHRLPQDGMMQVKAGGRVIDIRVSTIPVADGERLVLRLLSRDDSLRPLSALGMPEAVRQGFSALLARPNGIIAVCGPTGSGKTTTLYSALGAMDSRRRNIMTVEDPVEYRLAGIAQIQVKPKIGLTFAAGLRHILRQDPDVILVGETRDPETAEIAVRASLTGHMVLTTLHTNDAASAPMRLVDMGVEPYLLASCLRGVLAQRLVRRVCKECAKLKPFGSTGLSKVAEEIARASGCPGVLCAVGCRNCLEGYTGRTGIFEFLPCDTPVCEAIHDHLLDTASIRAAAGSSLLPMSDDAAAKLRLGETTPSEIAATL